MRWGRRRGQWHVHVLVRIHSRSDGSHYPSTFWNPIIHIQAKYFCILAKQPNTQANKRKRKSNTPNLRMMMEHEWIVPALLVQHIQLKQRTTNDEQHQMQITCFDSILRKLLTFPKTLCRFINLAAAAVQPNNQPFNRCFRKPLTAINKHFPDLISNRD